MKNRPPRPAVKDYPRLEAAGPRLHAAANHEPARAVFVRGQLENSFAGAPKQRGEHGFGADARPVIGAGGYAFAVHDSGVVTRIRHLPRRRERSAAGPRIASLRAWAFGRPEAPHGEALLYAIATRSTAAAAV